MVRRSQNRREFLRVSAASSLLLPLADPSGRALGGIRSRRTSGPGSP